MAEHFTNKGNGAKSYVDFYSYTVYHRLKWSLRDGCVRNRSDGGTESHAVFHYIWLWVFLDDPARHAKKTVLRCLWGNYCIR